MRFNPGKLLTTIIVSTLMVVLACTPSFASIVDNPVWQEQLGQLAGRITPIGGRTAADVHNFVWRELAPALEGNAYGQLNVITLNTAETRIIFGTTESLAPGGNMFRLSANELRFGASSFASEAQPLHGFFHEGRHGVQVFFQHNSVGSQAALADPVHQMFREFDACLPAHGGDVEHAFQCMINRGYTDGIDVLRELTPALNDTQRLGVGIYLSNRVPGSIVEGNNFTSAAMAHLEDAVTHVRSSGFVLVEDSASASRVLLLPGGFSAVSKARLALIVSKLAKSPVMRYLPLVGYAAAGYYGYQYYRDGDYLELCKTIAGLHPVIGAGELAGDLIVRPIAEATGVNDALGDIMTPFMYVVQYGELPPEDQPLYSNATRESWRRSAVDYLAKHLVWLFDSGKDICPAPTTKPAAINFTTVNTSVN